MGTANLRRYLNSLGKQVVNRSKANLKKTKGETKLGNSIKYKIVKAGGSLDIKFSMDSYGSFLDKGVSGTKKKQSFKNQMNQSEVSPFKFGTGSSKVGKSKGGMSGIMSKWIKKKGFQWKDKKTGRFMSYKSMGYIVARSIYRDGLKGLSFFQKPLRLGMKNYESQVSRAVAKDIEEALAAQNK
tara:strand:+ start:512 stop:1063 length:552 start_codon:yes stop_codon:yes gene_type:complete